MLTSKKDFHKIEKNMSSLELSISGDRADANNHQQNEGEHIKTVSLKMLDIADKLESLTQEYHKLKVDNKGKWQTSRSSAL